MDKHYFNPTPDTIYTNKGGGSYICLEAEGHFRAKFQRVSKYKWTFVAHGCQMYEDGTIEWTAPQADTSRTDTAQMGLQVPHFK